MLDSAKQMLMVAKLLPKLKPAIEALSESRLSVDWDDEEHAAYVSVYCKDEASLQTLKDAVADLTKEAEKAGGES